MTMMRENVRGIEKLMLESAKWAICIYIDDASHRAEPGKEE